MLKINSAELRKDTHDEERNFLWIANEECKEIEIQAGQRLVSLVVVFDYHIDNEVNESINFLVRIENEPPIKTNTFKIDSEGKKPGVHTIDNQ